MALLLREMNAQARIEGWVTGWADTDYSVLDDERIVGRIYREALLGEQKWRWFLNTSPYPAPIPHNGVADSLEEAKAAFKARGMNRSGIRITGRIQEASEHPGRHIRQRTK